MSREIVELGELIFPAKVIRCGRDEYPVFSMTMHDGIVEQKTRFKKDLASKDQSNYKVVKPGQLVVGFPIDEGVLYIQQLGKKGIMSPAYNIWDVNQEKVYPEFLELALHSPQSMSWYKAKLRGTTARRRNIPAKDLIKLKVPLPEKCVQWRIVKTFRQVKDDLSIFTTLNEKLDDLVKSRFIEMFGDPCDSQRSTMSCCPIEKFCEVRIGPFGSALHKSDYVFGGHALVNPSHIVKGKIKINKKLAVNEEKYASMKAYHLKKGDVVLGRRGEIGRCAVVNQEGLLCGTGSMILRPDVHLCLSEYLQHIVSFPTFAEALERDAVGVTMKNLNAKIVENAVVVLPPMSLQREFISFVHQVDKLKFDFDFLVSFKIPSICLLCLELDP